MDGAAASLNSGAGAAYVFHSAGASGISSAASTSANATLTGPAGCGFGGSVALGAVPVYPLLWATLGGVWRRRRRSASGDGDT